MSEKKNKTKEEAPEQNEKKEKKEKKARKKHPVIFGIFTTFFCIFVAGVLTFVVVGSYVLSYIHDYSAGSSVIDLDNYKNTQSQTSILYVTKSDGTTVEETRLHGNENRIWADYDQMPSDLIWAFVCLEDKRFFEHDGVDWVRTAGVLVNPDYEGQGGSTITQQLIKNLTGKNQTTFIRKFNEILRALNLERYYSKKDILEAYLNTVYLGTGAYGVQTAAETYFGKDVSDLTLAECAMLAGVTKAPYTLNPYYDFDAAKNRQKLCLRYMKEQGKITEKQYQKAKKAKLNLVDKSESSSSGKEEDDYILSWYDEYVIDQVIADLQAKYDYEYNEAWRAVYYGGVSIYSAVDLDMQSKLEDMYINRSGFPYGGYNKYGEQPNSTITVLDYKGRILGLIGGTGEKTVNRAYNRATAYNAKRQPGSSIKPLSVYGPAVNEGLISPGSQILEKAIYVDGRTWPRNFNGDHGSGAYTSVQNALAKSLNTVPARILKEILGLDTSFKYANEKFHLNLTSNDKTYSGLAVGGTYTGVTSLEMAAAFATFGNGGFYYKPYSYYKVVDRNGEVILDNTRNEGESVLSTEAANTMLSMLKTVVTQGNGTGYGAKVSGFETFAKTGTTSENNDKWFCGGTPYYVTAIWYGYDHPTNLYTGASNPAKTLFTYIFPRLHEGLEPRTFQENLEEAGLTTEGVSNVDVKSSPDASSTTGETSSTGTTESTTSATTTSATTTTEATTKETTTKESTTKATTEKETTEKKTQPDTTKKPVEPDTTKKPVEPDTTKKPVEPDTTKPAEPDTTKKPVEPDTTKPVQPDTTKKPVQPDTTKQQPSSAEAADAA